MNEIRVKRNRTPRWAFALTVVGLMTVTALAALDCLLLVGSAWWLWDGLFAGSPWPPAPSVLEPLAVLAVSLGSLVAAFCLWAAAIRYHGGRFVNNWLRGGLLMGILSALVASAVSVANSSSTLLVLTLPPIALAVRILANARRPARNHSCDGIDPVLW